MGSYGHMARCVGSRGVGETKDTLDGGLRM